MDEGQIHRGRGLVDLIAGVTPTLSGWTTDPTDAADITDGDISTFCTTGDHVIGGGWQECYLSWDLGAFYDVLIGCVGNAGATAGTPYLIPVFYDGASWGGQAGGVSGSTLLTMQTQAARCSQVRLVLTGSAAATITPNIREFHVWRL